MLEMLTDVTYVVGQEVIYEGLEFAEFVLGKKH